MIGLTFGLILVIFSSGMSARNDLDWILREIQNLKQENMDLREELQSLKAQRQGKVYRLILQELYMYFVFCG